jgi:tetratricopeptide (TPR) repeat protein
VSRRRRGIYGQTIYLLETALGAVWWWLRAVVTYPFYVIADAWYSLFGGARVRGPKVSWGTALLDAVLTVPSLIWHYTYSGAAAVGSAAQTWPSMMRLRDLAAGLPALLVGGLLAALFFFLPGVLHSKQEILNSYQESVQDTVAQTKTTKDPQELKILHEKILLYLRALSQFNPDDEAYRFGIARVYHLLGDVNRGQAIMQRLAPRHEAGFVPAHVWLAERLLAAAPSQQTYYDALAHLEHALSKDPSQREIHWLMAQVYFKLYSEYKPQAFSPWQPPRAKLLEDCAKHLAEAPKEIPDVALMLGRVHALQGLKDEARRDIGSLAESYKQVLKSKPFDVETRIRLAQAYRDIGEFEQAIQTLQDGNRLAPDPQLHFELSMTYFLISAHLQRNVPGSIEQQYGALRLGYVAYPPSPFIAARFIQGIVGSKDESTAARKSLAMLLESPELKGTPGRGMASFLLGLDAKRRSYPLDARRHMDDARSTNDDKIPNAVANLSLASLQRRTDMLDAATALQLVEEALLVWPENPNLQMVRGWSALEQQKNYASALSSLLKALPYRADDSQLQSMLSQAYRGLGQTQNAERHQKLAEVAKAKELELQQAKTAPAIIVKGPASGK